jgi:putative effector of murein hydrolase
MSWFLWLVLALVIAVFAAVTGIKAKGTRPVARTQLMGVARWVLLLIVLIIAYQAYRAGQ